VASTSTPVKLVWRLPLALKGREFSPDGEFLLALEMSVATGNFQIGRFGPTSSPSEISLLLTY